MDWQDIGRQEVWNEFSKGARVSPADEAKDSSIYNMLAAADYSFADQMGLIGGASAGAIIAAAAQDAQQVIVGSQRQVVIGWIGIASGTCCFVLSFFFIPLIIVALIIIYFGTSFLRAGNDKTRRAEYDKIFIADVEKYARSAINGFRNNHEETV